MEGSQSRDKRTAENTEAWILGSGTASLATALYLIKHHKVQPPRIHVLDKHESVEQGSHYKGNASEGYDQFAGCLPVPGGVHMKELLAMIPSTKSEGRSILDEIQKAEADRLSAKEVNRTSFLVQKNGVMEHIPIDSLNLSFKNRISLLRFLLRREKSLAKSQIQDLFSNSFFESAFWAVWSAQFGFQPWHSAAEFRRAVCQYLPEIHGLRILDCLDITGYYQFEFLYRPIYSFLKSCGVDFRFRTEVKNIEVAQNSNQRTITGLDLIQDQLGLHTSLGKNDIVLVNLGSTISGSTIGTNDTPPTWHSITADDMLDQNWSAWLDLGNKNRDFGSPYNFCTRQSESILESFTITTEDVKFFDKLKEISRCTSEAGAFIFLKDSRWRMSLCIPSQPVFTEQPRNIRVLWGLAHLPECKGNYVDKPMLWCSGTDIMAELLNHLGLNHQEPMQRTITIPRAMPRMSAILLTRALNDRPQVIPQAFANVGLVGQFVEIPRRTCVDISYSIRAAKMAVSGLMGSPTFIEPSTSMVSAVWKIMLDNGQTLGKHSRAFPYKWKLKYDQIISQEAAGDFMKGFSVLRKRQGKYSSY